MKRCSSSRPSVSRTEREWRLMKTILRSVSSTLAAENGRGLVDRIAAGAPAAILSTSPRPFSAASVLETDRGMVFIKRHSRSVRDTEGLLEEHRFMAHLSAHGISVPHVFAAESGSTVFEAGESSYEVHKVPPGLDLYEKATSWTPFHSAAHARSAGAMLARMHLAAESYGAPS